MADTSQNAAHGRRAHRQAIINNPPSIKSWSRAVTSQQSAPTDFSAPLVETVEVEMVDLDGMSLRIDYEPKVAGVFQCWGQNVFSQGEDTNWYLISLNGYIKKLEDDSILYQGTSLLYGIGNASAIVSGNVMTGGNVEAGVPIYAQYTCTPAGSTFSDSIWKYGQGPPFMTSVAIFTPFA